MDEDSDDQSFIEQTSEGSFARNYTMYGMLIVVMMCTIWLWNVFLIGLSLIGALSFYFVGEFRLHKKIQEIITVPNSKISRTSFLIYSFAFLGVSVFLYLIYKDSMPFFKVNGDAISFTVTYEKSLLLTVSLSTAFLGLRYFLIAVNAMDFLNFEFGKYGLLYRLLFIIRSTVVTESWVKYFAEDEKVTFMSVFLSNRISLPGVYIAFKVLFIGTLIWDLSSTRSKYKSLKRKALRKGQGVCDVCGNKSCFILQCGHRICKNCRKSKLKTSPFCPKCIHEVCKPHRFAFTNGYSSVASIFCCV